MHVPTQGQWWSNLYTHISQSEQWDVLGGRYIPHVLQNLKTNKCPFTLITYLWSSKASVPSSNFPSTGIISSSSEYSIPLRCFLIIPGSMNASTIWHPNTQAWKIVIKIGNVINELSWLVYDAKLNASNRICSMWIRPKVSK